jgi:hypothetical protein
VQQAAERAVDERRGLVELQVAHVALAELELDAGRLGPFAGLLEHRRRRVDPDHGAAGRLGNRDRDAAAPDRQLDDRAVCRLRQLDVERHVLGHRRRPLVVALGEALVPAHAPMLRRRRLWRWSGGLCRS